jgi:serine/threonine protein kinase
VTRTATFLTPPPAPAVGGTFAGRYQVTEELGKGGMGRVYKAYDLEIREAVALKVLNPEIAADDSVVERFRNELKIARRISHRNVCRMFDLGREGETTYISMEYVSGEDLKTLLRRIGHLPARKAIAFAGQIAEGLAEAHRLGVVHRDLKPQNVMIDREGQARIMDFGIARSLKGKGITGEGVVIGTPEYMSPEQVEGKEADQRSDIHSLGIILYEMITGRAPFEGDTPFSVAYKHRHEAPEEPRKFNPQLPDALNRVILRCMEPAQDNRGGEK